MFFLLYLLLVPRHRYVTVRYVHVYWRHPRFHHPLYWLTGLAFYELAFWLLVAEVVAVYLLVALVVRFIAALVERRRAKVVAA